MSVVLSSKRYAVPEPELSSRHWSLVASGWSAMGLGRWAAGLLLAVGSVFVGARFVAGADEAQETVFVPVSPCRLIDTRPGASNVGPRSVPLPENVGVSFGVHRGDDAGSVCDIPVAATAVGSNVTVVGPTANSFLTVFPSDVERPNVSSLNYVAGQAPTPNAVTIPLSGAGRFDVVNRFGTVNLIVDINGYYLPSDAAGRQGPAGPAGAAGPVGSAGADGAANRLSDGQIAQLKWFEDPGATATIEVGTFPVGIAFSGSRIYVANFNDGTVSVIDPVAAEVTSTIEVGDGPLAVAFDGVNIYVTNREDNTVSVIDPTTDTVIDTINVGDGPNALAFNGDHMWVANIFGGTIEVVDKSTGAIVHTIRPAGQPHSVAFDGSRMWVTNSVQGTVVVVHADSFEVLGNVLTNGAGPAEIAFDGTSMFVSNQTSGEISVIDVASRQVVIIEDFGQPAGLAFDGRNMYALDQENHEVSVISPFVDDTILSTIAGGQGPRGAVFDGTNIWVTNSGSGTVSKLLPF